MAGISPVWQRLPDERPKWPPPRSVKDGAPRRRALGEGWHPGVPGEEGLVGGGRAPQGGRRRRNALGSRGSGRAQWALQGSHSVATWSRARWCPQGAEAAGAHEALYLHGAKFTNRSGCARRPRRLLRPRRARQASSRRPDEQARGLGRRARRRVGARGSLGAGRAGGRRRAAGSPAAGPIRGQASLRQDLPAASSHSPPAAASAAPRPGGAGSAPRAPGRRAGTPDARVRSFISMTFPFPVLEETGQPAPMRHDVC